MNADTLKWLALFLCGFALGVWVTAFNAHRVADAELKKWSAAMVHQFFMHTTYVYGVHPDGRWQYLGEFLGLRDSITVTNFTGCDDGQPCITDTP